MSVSDEQSIWVPASGTTRRDILIRGGFGAASLFGLGALAACGSDGDGAATSGGEQALKTVAYANIGEQTGNWIQVKRGFQNDTKQLGVKLHYYNNDLDGETVRRNAELMVAADPKPQVVINWNPIAGVGASIARIYERASIPAIAVNTRGAGDSHWYNLDELLLGADSAKVVAKHAKERGWNGDNTTVVFANAASLGETVNICLGHFYVELQKQLEGFDPIKNADEIASNPQATSFGKDILQVDGQAVLDVSHDAVANIVSKIPPNDNVILYTPVTDSTLGAWRALAGAGFGDRTLTAGLAGGPPGYAQLRNNPGWVAEAEIFSPQWSQYLLAMAQAVLNGTKLPVLTTSPGAVLTKDLTIEGTSIAPMTKFFKNNDFTSATRLPPLQPVVDGPYGPQGNAPLAETGILQQFGDVEGLSS